MNLPVLLCIKNWYSHFLLSFFCVGWVSDAGGDRRRECEFYYSWIIRTGIYKVRDFQFSMQVNMWIEIVFILHSERMKSQIENRVRILIKLKYIILTLYSPSNGQNTYMWNMWNAWHGKKEIDNRDVGES